MDSRWGQTQGGGGDSKGMGGREGGGSMDVILRAAAWMRGMSPPLKSHPFHPPPPPLTLQLPVTISIQSRSMDGDAPLHLVDVRKSSLEKGLSERRLALEVDMDGRVTAVRNSPGVPSPVPGLTPATMVGALLTDFTEGLLEQQLPGGGGGGDGPGEGPAAPLMAALGEEEGGGAMSPMLRAALSVKESRLALKTLLASILEGCVGGRVHVRGA